MSGVVLPGYSFLKRSFDLVMAILVIVAVLSWLLPLLALLIKLDSSGPAFFIQKRVGRNGQLFRCYKLRSMVVNDRADELPAAGDDRRITRVGYWLRRTHLDELPQFWNVATGSMSLVGPRPYMPADFLRIAALVPGIELRHAVRPGITGMAQSLGLHGAAARDGQIIAERWRWELYYIRHAGFVLDMQILGETLVLMLRGQRASVLQKLR